MVLIDKLCNRLTEEICTRTKKIDAQNQEVIHYGLYIFIADSAKIAVILLLSFLLSIPQYTVMALVSFGLLRTFAGGVHSKTWTSCLITNSLLSFGTVYLSLYLSNIPTIIMGCILFPVTFGILYLYAPSDHENKPVVSIKQRRQLRIISFTILLLEYVIAFAVFQPLSNIFMISTLIVAFAMLPITYKLTKNQHGKSDCITR